MEELREDVFHLVDSELEGLSLKGRGGEPIKGATILLSSLDEPTEYRSITSSKGLWSVFLRPGTYDVFAEARGYKEKHIGTISVPRKGE